MLRAKKKEKEEEAHDDLSREILWNERHFIIEIK